MISRRTLLAGAISTSVVTAASAARDNSRRSEIEDLFEQWQAELSAAPETDADVESWTRYRDLQERITSMHPTSARELAIMVVVETDGGDSVCRDDFLALIKRLANSGRSS